MEKHIEHFENVYIELNNIAISQHQPLSWDEFTEIAKVSYLLPTLERVGPVPKTTIKLYLRYVYVRNKAFPITYNIYEDLIEYYTLCKLTNTQYLSTGTLQAAQRRLAKQREESRARIEKLLQKEAKPTKTSQSSEED